MPTPDSIDGVLVLRESICKPDTRFNDHIRFRYQQHNFPSSLISSEDSPPCIPMLRHLLRICVIQPPTSDSPRVPPNLLPLVDLNNTPYFFGYWPSADRWQSAYSQAHRNRPVLFYRDDFKPLHPGQIEAICSFCDRLCLVITPPLLFGYLLPDPFENIKWEIRFKHRYPFAGLPRDRKFEKLVYLIKSIWMEYCTVDNFSAFFDRYRHDKLLEGAEDWRKVGSLYP